MQVLCGQCGQTLTVADALAGGTLPCPHCGHRISLPAFGETPAEVAQASNGVMEVTLEDLQGSAPDDDGGFADLARQSAVRRVRVKCAACSKVLTLGGRVWGQKIKCPGCGTTLAVPHPDEEFDLSNRRGRGNDADVEPLNVDIPEEVGPGEAPDAASEQPSAVEQAPASQDIGETAPEAPDLSPGLAVSQAPGIGSAGPDVARNASEQPEATEGETPSGRMGETPMPLQDARETPATQSQPLRLPRWVLYAIIGAAVVLAAIAIPMLVNRAYQDKDAKKRNLAQIGGNTPAVNAAIDNAPGDNQPADNAPANNAPPANNAADNRVATAPANSAGNEANTAPPVEVPKDEPMRVLDARQDVFAANGYFPAAARSVYVKLKLEVKAGKGQMSLDASTARLQGKGGPFACIGWEAAASKLPVRAADGRVDVPAGQAREVVLVFETPSALMEMKLDWPTVGQADLNLGDPSPEAGPALGIWKECPPRNLRPLLADPLMGEIQKSADIALNIKRQGDQTVAVVGTGGLKGVVTKAADENLYKIEFTRDDQHLTAELRIIDGGKKAVLYLADKPMHQITFERK